MLIFFYKILYSVLWEKSTSPWSSVCMVPVDRRDNFASTTKNVVEKRLSFM